MGSPKAGLDWHGSTLLRRVTGIVVRAVAPGPVVVVSAPGQDLPDLPPGLAVVADERPDRGPLQGLAAGLAAIGDRADVAYVSSVDVPLLHPAFVRAVIESLSANVDIAVPETDGRPHPMAAAYRVDVLPTVQALLAEDRLALTGVLDRCRVRRLTRAELPALESLTNLNSPADYERARAWPAPKIHINGSPAQAWTLGDVLSDDHATVVLNGTVVDADPELPLVDGDVVAF